MKKERAEKILAIMLDSRKKKLARHLWSVSVTALRIAQANGVAVAREKILAAGEMHDAAKKVPVKLIKDYLGSIENPSVEPPDEFELKKGNGKLLHGIVAAEIMAVEFGLTDGEVLQAVRYHTTGHPEMNTAGRILMVADYAEPLRPWREKAAEIRNLAERDLDAGFARVLKERYSHLLKSGMELHPRTLAAWRRYCN